MPFRKRKFAGDFQAHALGAFYCKRFHHCDGLPCGTQIELGVTGMKITRADASIPAVSITKIG
jgi:hypothetical protein